MTNLTPEQRFEFSLRHVRSDTYTVNVRIAHPTTGAMINYGVFDKVTGGETDSGVTSKRPGGFAQSLALGGPKTVSNLVLSRGYRLARDHDVVQQLLNSVGRCQVVVSIQPLDINANAYGKPIVYTGILKRVKTPDVDSESSAAGMLELEVIVDGEPSA
jgi:hypothetical protein